MKNCAYRPQPWLEEPGFPRRVERLATILTTTTLLGGPQPIPNRRNVTKTQEFKRLENTTTAPWSKLSLINSDWSQARPSNQ
jgi:hypothetical protein